MDRFEDVLSQENNHQIDEDCHKHKINKEDVHHLYYLSVTIFVLVPESMIQKNSRIQMKELRKSRS